MKRIRVLHILLSMEIGGMEQVVLNLVRELDRTRFEPMVACLNTEGVLAKEFSATGVKVLGVQKMIPRWSFFYPKTLTKLIREENVDIVHSHSGCWHKAAWAAYLANVKAVIHTEHGRWVPESQSVVWLDRIFSHITSRIIVVSDVLRDYLITYVKIKKDKINVIYNGVPDLTQKSLPTLDDKTIRALFNNRTPIIGTIGRLALVKDYETLLLAMQKVVPAVNNAKLVMVGDGPERNRLEKLARELGLENSVFFLGARRDVANLLSSFTLFALSSISEGTSMTILEAMCAGKPVIATNVGGNKYLVEDGKSGLLVQPKQPEQLALSIIRLLTNREEAHTMGYSGRMRYLEFFTAERMAKQYQQLYEELIGN